MSINKLAHAINYIQQAFRYPTISEHINKGHYLVMMSPLYTKIPDYYLEFDIPPIYEYDSNVQANMVRGTCTIAEMIDMYINGYCFVILRDEDIIDIYNIIDKYIGLLNNVDIKDHKVRLQIDRVNRFKNALHNEYICACRRLNLTPNDENTFSSFVDKMFK